MTARHRSQATAALILLAVLLLSSSTYSFVHGQAVVATAKDGGYSLGEGVAYDSGKGEVFVSNYINGTVDVFSDSDNAEVATISTGPGPGGLAYDSGKNEVFVAGDSSEGGLVVISDQSNSVVTNLALISSESSGAVAYDPAKGEIFLGIGGPRIAAGSVSIISDADNSVVASVPVGNYPAGFVYDSAKGEMFVSNFGDDTVSVISDSNNSVVATVGVGAGPLGMAYDPAKGEIFVANNGGNTVSVISDSTDKVVATVPVVLGPYGVAYDSTKGEVYVTNRGNETTTSTALSVISDTTDAVVASVNVGAAPTGVAYDPVRGEIFVAITNDIVVVSDSATGVGTTGSAESTQTSASTTTSSTCKSSGQGGPGTVDAGAYPTGLAYDSGNGEAYVGDYSGPTVTAICDSNNLVVSTIYVPALNNPGFQGVASPQYVAYDSGRGEIFVANIHGNSVTVISDSNNSVVATIGLGNDSENYGQGVSPLYLAYDSGKGEIFVANSGLYTQNGTQGIEASTVSVISDATNTVVTTLPEGDGIYGIAYDSAKGEVFVATTLANNTGIISVISDSTNSVVATIRPSELGAMAYDSASGEMFVAGGTGVDVISDATNTVIANIPVKDAGDIAYDSGKGELFVVTADTNSTTIISAATNSVIGTVPAGPIPYEITYDSGKGELFVTNPTADTVTIISDSASAASSSATAASSAKSSSISLSPVYVTVVAINAAILFVLAGVAAIRRGGRFTTLQS